MTIIFIALACLCVWALFKWSGKQAAVGREAIRKINLEHGTSFPEKRAGRDVDLIMYSGLH